MPTRSSWVTYLPPALWANEDPAARFSLSSMLRIFEKLLTGIDDGETIVHGDHEHLPIATVIDRLHRLFDPWTTPSNFLDWLASWAALELSPIWEEYERRKVTSEIVQIYARRGLKTGLEQYLDLYTIAATRPRISVDDSGNVLAAEPVRDRFVPVRALVSQGAFVRESGTTAHEGLARPRCIALAPDGKLLVGDAGAPPGFTSTVRPGVWRISPTGDYEFAGTPPSPRPLGPAAWALAGPIALAVQGAAPWRLYVLDGTPFAGQTALYRLSSGTLNVAVPLLTVGQLGAVTPVAMAFDTLPPNHLLVLDRGGGGTPARILDVDVQAGPPPTVAARNLTTVVNALSLHVEPGGDLIVGDARTPSGVASANLVRIDRSNPAAWVESDLLPAANPFYAPTAVLRKDPSRLLVLDVGLKPLFPTLANPFIRDVAEPAGVWWVDLGGATASLAPAVEPRQFVFPRGMVLSGDSIYVCDAGEPEVAGVVRRPWRIRQHEFGVLVHFSNQRPPPTGPSYSERAAIVQNIREIVNAQKPANAHWTVVSAV